MTLKLLKFTLTSGSGANAVTTDFFFKGNPNSYTGTEMTEATGISVASAAEQLYAKYDVNELVNVTYLIPVYVWCYQGTAEAPTAEKEIGLYITREKNLSGLGGKKIKSKAKGATQLSDWTIVSGYMRQRLIDKGI